MSYTEEIADGAFGDEPKKVPVRVNFQGEPIGEAIVNPDGRATVRIGDSFPPCPMGFACTGCCYCETARQKYEEDHNL